MLNPVSISVSSSGTDKTVGAANISLDAAIATAVATAQGLTDLPNQITITPTGMIFDGTNYIASAMVIYTHS